MSIPSQLLSAVVLSSAPAESKPALETTSSRGVQPTPQEQRTPNATKTPFHHCRCFRVLSVQSIYGFGTAPIVASQMRVCYITGLIWFPIKMPVVLLMFPNCYYRLVILLSFL